MGSGALTTDEQDRYAELMVFAAGVHIPLDVAALLWGRTAGWNRAQAARFRDRLSARGLLTVRVDGGIVLHAHPSGCPEPLRSDSGGARATPFGLGVR